MKSVAALAFPGFQTLDYFGPIELLGWLPDDFDIYVVAENPGCVTSRNGQRIVVDQTFADNEIYDVVLVPGGPGTPIEEPNETISRWLRSSASSAELVMAVCTGSVLLASAGLLNGRHATTNKMDFQWAVPFGPEVNWVGKARWVEDGKFYTSSGVSAGMDMTLAVISRLVNDEAARHVASCAEYIWNQDPSDDPFAVEHGIG